MYLYDSRQSFTAYGNPDGSARVASGKSPGARLYAYSEEVIYYWKTFPGKRIESHTVDAAITRHAQESGFSAGAIVRANIGDTIATMKPRGKTSRQTREAQEYMQSLFD